VDADSHLHFIPLCLKASFFPFCPRATFSAASPLSVPEMASFAQAAPSLAQLQQEEEYESPAWTYSPGSSPLLTPTLETVTSFVGSSLYSDASDASSEPSLFDLSRSTNSSSSSLEGDSTYESAFGVCQPISAPLKRAGTCRYAQMESVPSSIAHKKGALGGVGMVRSFSNPVATLEVARARESIYAEELRRQDLEHGASPPKRSHTTDSFDLSPRPRFTASSLKQHAQDVGSPERRPALGRFLSFEPKLLKR
jgi:hypothetical protein